MKPTDCTLRRCRVATTTRVTVAAGLLLSLASLAVGVKLARAAFPGSSGLIAVERSPDSNKLSAIWVLDWQTSAARQVTNRGYAREPAFSPDGQWIAFVSDLPRGRLNIWAIHPDGSGLHRLTKGAGELATESPAFSANGRWVAFQADGRAGRREIERVALSGGDRRILVPRSRKVSAFGPVYSPDGRHLAWVEWRESPRAVPSIYVGDSIGHHGLRLTAGSEPEFSPDGRNIVFRREGRCADGGVGTKIETLSLATGLLRQLRASCQVALGSPTYSPDGGWIAYTVYRGERSEIAFSPVPGIPSAITPPVALGAELPVDANPTWQALP